MAIVQVRKPPKTGPRVVGRALRDLRRRRPDPRGFLGGAAVSLSGPLPVYRLRLDDIETRESLGSAKLTGWRYLIEPAEGGSVAYADIREKGGDSQFASFSQNRNAERLTEAANLAEQVASGLPSDCEARILDVPALYMSAVWLTSPEPTFIPYIDAEQLADPAVNIRVDPDFVDRLLNRAHIAQQHLQDLPSGSEPPGTPFVKSSVEDGNELAHIGTRGSLLNDHTISIVSAILILTVVIQVLLVKSWT